MSISADEKSKNIKTLQIIETIIKLLRVGQYPGEIARQVTQAIDYLTAMGEALKKKEKNG